MINLYEMSDVASVSLNIIRQDTDEFKQLAESLPLNLADFSMLNEYSRCSREAVIRYGARLAFTENSRSMPLEAGSAFHEVAAAMRLIQLFDQGHYDLMNSVGQRELGEVRYLNFKEIFESEGTNSALLYALNSSDFYDDPRDSRRTMTNLEECAIAYAEHPKTCMYPVYIDTEHNLVGCEQRFIVKVEFTLQQKDMFDGDVLTYYYGGKIDGIHCDDKGNVFPFENKTGSRIDDAWSAGMVMSHQVTGYVVATQLLTGKPVTKALVHGIQVPLPKLVSNGIRAEFVTRNSWRIHQWLAWLLHNMQLRMHYGSDVASAIESTHACNKYFKACTFMPLCDAEDKDGFKDALDGMVPVVWNPWAQEN